MTTTLSLAHLLQHDDLRDHLRDHGLGPEQADSKAELFRSAAATLEHTGIDADAALRALFVPGRIEVLGKHVDYAGGHSITCAVDRGFCMLAQPRDDNAVRIIRADGHGETTFELDPELSPASGTWTNYPMTAARRLARNFPNARRGANIAFASDLPPAAGLSSSSALIVAVFFALVRINGLEHDPRYKKSLGKFAKLAGYLGAIENGSSFADLPGDRGVGTFGGSQDHTAIIANRADQLGLFSYCPVRLVRFIDMPRRYTFVVGVSGTEAVKTGSAQHAYNRAAQLAAESAELWRRATGRNDLRIKDAIASAPEAGERVRTVLQKHPELLRRFDHFYAENEQIVPQAVEAFEKADIAALGPLVDRSQQLAEQWLDNQVPQTIHLARSARQLGAAAASAFGAGFGGSVWALVHRDRLERFIDAWRTNYADAFAEESAHADFFNAHPGPAAFELASEPLAQLR